MSEPADLPADDAPVADDVALFRLVPTDQCNSVDGEWEFQSAAFDNNDAEDMSVVVGDTLARLTRVPEDLPERIFQDPGRWGVAVLVTRYVRHEEAQEVLRTSTVEERAHGDVRGPKNSKRRKRLKKHAEWVIRPHAPA